MLNSRANPFQSNNTHTEWSSNNLILTDPTLRQKAGVSVLDNDISEIFNQNGHVVPAGSQNGGSASGAPFHLSKYGNRNVHQYAPTPINAWDVAPMPTRKPATQQSGGATLPYHYFANNGRT